MSKNKVLVIQIEKACEIMADNPKKKSYGKIMEEIGWAASKNSLRTKMQKYANENFQKYMIEDGKIKYTTKLIMEQELINKLSELEGMSRSAAHTYIKNIANGEMNKEDFRNLRGLLSDIYDVVHQARISVLDVERHQKQSYE
jgi:hypothetical protein